MAWQTPNQHASRAIIWAPRARLTLRMAGSSSGLSPTASATANSKRLDGRAAVDHVHDEYEEDHDQHGAGQQVAESANAAVEFGFWRPQRQTMSDRTKLRLRPVATTRHRAVPLRTLVPRNTQFIRSRKPAVASTAPGCFSTGKLSPVSTASLTKKSVASRMMPSAGTRLPAESNTTSPGTISSAAHRVRASVPQHGRLATQMGAAISGGRLRPVLPGIANAHADGDDRPTIVASIHSPVTMAAPRRTRAGA